MSPLLDTLIHRLGPLGVALGAGLEGETAVVVGGALARHGAFDPVVAGLAALLGSFVADQLFFAAGRTQREAKLVRRVADKPAFARALRLVERHPVAFCLAFRFVYGFRIAGPVAIGVSRVATGLFVALNALSATVWAIVFTALGYRFGKAFERLLATLLTPAHLALAAGLVLAVVGVVVLVRRTRSAREEVVHQRPEGSEAG